MTKFIVIFTLLASATCSHAQLVPASPKATIPPGMVRTAVPAKEPSSGSVFVGCGFLLAENYGRTTFTVLLPAEQARSVPNGKFTAWILDDVLVETVSTTVDDVKAPKLRGAPLLREYMDLEMQYLATIPGWAGVERPEIGNIDLGVPFPTLSWMAKPTGNVEVLGQKITGLLYVASAIEDVVFVVAAPIRSPADLPAAGPMIERILRTLRRTTAPTDIHALSDQIKNSDEPWPGCPRK